ncbi:MAG: uroporphyrinogen-III synthase, partial [Candidatus Eremiobacteraeota bacterium]|nr:uroporphyrinogen-III synthase [Candidatus Eremiobacteraeota bacterium]
SVLGAPIHRARLKRPVETLDEAEAVGAEVAAMLPARAPTACVLLPRTRERPSTIAQALRAQGVEVLELRAGDDGPDPAERSVDMVLFPSSGSVAAAGAYLARLQAVRPRPAILAMGPASAHAARSAGYEPDAVSTEASIEAFVALVRERLA